MALNTLPAGAFADDAISSDKINLANTFAFTGTVTGIQSDFELLNTTTISSAVGDVSWGSSYVTDTHKIYILYFKNIMLNANDNIGVRIGADGVITSGTYQKGGFADSMEATSYGGVSGSGDSGFHFGGHHENTAGGEPFSGQATFYNMRDARNKHIIMQDVRDGVNSHRFDVKGCILNTTSVFNTIQVYTIGSNSMDNGQLSLYGLRT
tara:strand:- start:158 stop:784 length:627 start_codon:yes stop_codon:yes gene_type:complete